MKIVLVYIIFALNEVRLYEVNTIFTSEGNLKLGFLIQDCSNSSRKSSSLTRTFVTSAIWIIDRLNSLEYLGPQKFGVDIYKTCSEKDFYNSVFDLFQQKVDSVLLGGIISTDILPEKVQDFCEVLDMETSVIKKSWSHLVKASVRLLSALDWKQNVTVISSDENVLRDFFKFSKRELICVKNVFSFRDSMNFLTKLNGPCVIFGNSAEIQFLMNNIGYQKTFDGTEIIIAPTDGTQFFELPENSYVIHPPYSEYSQNYTKSPKVSPSPLLFDVANPILNFVQSTLNSFNENCNDSTCLNDNLLVKRERAVFLPWDILSLLKIEPLYDKFVYNIFRVENLTLLRMELNSSIDTPRSNVFQSFIKSFTYNIFNETIVNLESTIQSPNTSFPQQLCPKDCTECINFFLKPFSNNLFVTPDQRIIFLRSEAWIFAFLAVSLLGILFCIAVFSFIGVRACKNDIFEGNPILTILLLSSVICMYCSVMTFAVDGNKYSKNGICVAKALSVTLSYASAFSLLLGRSILLATISKEIGFMAHVAGPVQSFLCLFIFGVQGALSLQVIDHCEQIFFGHSVLYLLSYNIVLLILLICVSPLIAQSQRNYKEGKYFVIAVLIIAFIWFCWLPAYVLLEEEWKDPILCTGLISTASALLGTIFIPRTYIMTIAVARDRLTSALPSLATATSAMDIYRASTQPLYDCVNIAAINAVNVARVGMNTPIHHTDVYSTPALPDEEEYVIQGYQIPEDPDKVTSF